MAVLPMAPALVLAGMGHSAVILPWALAALSGALQTMAVGWRLGLTVTIGLSVFGGVGYVAGQEQNAWLAAVVFGIFAFGYGYFKRWGLSTHVMAVVALDMIIVTAKPIDSAASNTVNGLWFAGIILAAGLWGIGVGLILNRIADPFPRTPLPMSQVWRFATLIAIVLAIAMWVVVDRQWEQGGAWFVLTLIIVLQPDYATSVQKIVFRGIGTALGFLIAIAIGMLVDQQWLLTLLAFTLLIIAMVITAKPKIPYWVFVLFLTPSIVLLDSSSGQVVSTADSRLGFTMLGVAIALLLALAAYPFQKRSTTAMSSTGAASQTPRT